MTGQSIQRSEDLKDIFAWGGEKDYLLRLSNERIMKLSKELEEEKAKNALPDEGTSAPE